MVELCGDGNIESPEYFIVALHWLLISRLGIQISRLQAIKCHSKHACPVIAHDLRIPIDAGANEHRLNFDSNAGFMEEQVLGILEELTIQGAEKVDVRRTEK